MQGIYFLYLDDILTYVGKTANLPVSLKTHKATNLKFTAYKFIEVTNLSDMAILELVYIDKLKPVGNKKDKFTSTTTFNIPTVDVNTLEVEIYNEPTEQLIDMTFEDACYIYNDVMAEYPPYELLHQHVRNQPYKDMSLKVLEYLWIGSTKADFKTRLAAKATYLVRATDKTRSMRLESQTG